MPGETYIQVILDQLNSVEVRGSENLAHMVTAIKLLEDLKKDIIEHKEPESKSEEVPAQNV